MPRVKEFLLKNYPSISAKESLESAIDLLLNPDLPPQERADCLVALDTEGRAAGLINAWLVLSALAVGAGKEEEPAVDALMRDRVKLPVTAAMATEFPVAHPDDDLLDTLGLLGANYFECLPVMKDGVYLGAVRTIDIFQAMAEEVLSSGGGVFTEG